MKHQKAWKSRGKAAICTLIAAMLTVQAVPGISAFGAEQAGDTASYTVNGITLRLNKATGDLTGIDFPSNGSLNDSGSISFDGAYVDFCQDTGDGAWEVQGSYLRNTLYYQNMDWLNTYQLPGGLSYNNQEDSPRRDPSNVTITKGSDNVKVRYEMKPYDDATESFRVETSYTVNKAGFVAMDSTLTNINQENVVINGAATVVSGLDVAADAAFEFPGNLPADVFSCEGIPKEYVVAGQYSSPLIHFFNGETDINLIFANEYEKWMPSVTKSPEGKMEVINLSCTMDELKPGEKLFLGTQFFQLADSGKAYSAAQKLYSANGWEAPTDGVKGSPIYSGHPAGVSDNDFEGAAGTLDDYQADIARIKALGFDSLWMLPVFEHPDSGGSVYLPYNMEHIDARYSKRATDNMTLSQKRSASYQEMKDFGAAAQKAGLNFMIDYVPHGPYLYNPDQRTEADNLYDNPWMTPERLSWASVDRWWQDPNPEYTHWRSEWDCYAFDFANPDYLDYMYNLAKTQSTDFSMAGTRIDAVMGSLPNWNPSGANRISQTGLFGGAAMTKAIRKGIVDAGQTPLVLPENNNPTPYYAESTDLFYDMPFYVVTKNARDAGLSETEFAAVIAHWLKTENASSTKGMQYGRFLENHDTVAPWYDNYDQARAVEVYGVDKARALWTLLSTIDGAPIIYQNDEIDNESFFTSLLAMRKAQFGADNAMDIEYYNDVDSGVVAFRRFDANSQKLVLVNLLDQEAERDFTNMDVGGVRFSTADPTVVYGSAVIDGDQITLPAYASVVITLKGGTAFTGENTANQYLVTDVGQNFEQMAQDYQSFQIVVPKYEPAPIEGKVLFDPVEEFSAETADGGVWKYMYYDLATQELKLCTYIGDDTGEVWRAYRTENGSVEWTGAGRSGKNMELDTNPGGEKYGILTFVAPKTGTYTIPEFNIQGKGEGFSSILVVLKNGKQVNKSTWLVNEYGKTKMPEQSYQLDAGDTLMFYGARMDGKYCYFDLEGMKLQYKNLEEETKA